MNENNLHNSKSTLIIYSAATLSSFAARSGTKARSFGERAGAMSFGESVTVLGAKASLLWPWERAAAAFERGCVLRRKLKKYRIKSVSHSLRR